MRGARARLKNWTLARSTGGMILVWAALLSLPILMILALGSLGTPALIFWALPIAVGTVASGYLGQAIDWREKAGSGTCRPQHPNDD